MKKCILVYDDDLEILFVCKTILEKNYRIETRTRCDTIIDDIYLEKPDLILMDLWIPEMGGENAIKLIKNKEETKFIPIILFSAHDKIREIYQRANANDFLKKPFEITAITNIVEKNLILQRRRFYGKAEKIKK
jgi:DNA-binding NtrC family response regulator